MEQENILHICAKRRVASTLFNTIVTKLSSSNKTKLMQAADSNGDLPLHLAAHTNKKESYICEGLIEAMKQINDSDSLSILDVFSIKNRSGKTAVHEASQQGHVHILKLMWEALSPVEQKNRAKGFFMTDGNNRFICLHLAAMNGNDKGKEFCIQQSAFHYPLSFLCLTFLP